MTRRSCDGPGLLAAFASAVANLERNVDEINALNVFPVPDGDTGTNMAATVRAALDEAETVSGGSLEAIASAISFGALMGARGNSGVITSQIFRGMAEGLGGKRRFNGLDLAHALDRGTRTAYGAVAKPVEGTILTVIRESAAAAVAAAERQNDIEAVLTVAVDAAERAVARTPSLLPILREAGVVDSGGQGLYRLLQGALLYISGEGPVDAERPATGRPGARASTLVAHADEGWGYETMFLLSAPTGRLLDVDAIRARLEAMGQSVLVAGDGRAVKIHVHNERPDEVIAYGLSLGSLSRVSVENLDDQARDVRETRAAAFTADAPTTDQPVEPAGGTAADPVAPPAATDPAPPGPGVVAVVAGPGLRSVFESFGVDQILEGGQTANPSTGELLRIVRLARSREVIVLPNNPNIRLAAEQAAALCDDKRIVVVPTRNAAEGLAALMALDPTKDAAANVGPMTVAGRAVQSMVVCEAIRDARFGRRKVRKGQAIVLDPDDGLVAVASDWTKAVLGGVAALEPGFELVTLYYGDGAVLAEAEALAREVGAAVDGAEVEVVHGGQPHYRYLIAAE
jgi:DAK2 domain fusion protein YloV